MTVRQREVSADGAWTEPVELCLDLLHTLFAAALLHMGERVANRIKIATEPAAGEARHSLRNGVVDHVRDCANEHAKILPQHRVLVADSIVLRGSLKLVVAVEELLVQLDEVFA